MKVLALLALLGVVVFVSTDYAGNFEDYDVAKVFANDEHWQSAVNCILDKGPCEEEAQLLKDTLIEGVADKCAKCSLKQLTTLQQAYTALVQKDPESAYLIVQKLDPAGEFKALYTQA